MFNQDFYPTPESVADQMQIDAFGKTIYEPSAGSGNLLKYLRSRGAKHLLASEKDSRLASIAKEHCDTFLGYDFLSVVAEQITHVDAIVMNPPFSNGAEHVLHAWEIAPPGAEIISLYNHHSIMGSYLGPQGRELKALIKNYGSVDNLGPCFNASERKTNVEIGLIKLYKPMLDRNHDRFEGFYMDEKDEGGEPGMIKADEIQRIVGSYKGAIQNIDNLFAAAKQVTEFSKVFGVSEIGVQFSRDETVMGKEDFAIQLQVKAWRKIFAKVNIEKYVTRGVMKDIHEFARRQQNIPFTVRNVYRMFEIIVGTSDEMFGRSLVEAIDNFTQYTHENRYGVEGWKTNVGHLLNKKFIVNYMVENRGYKSGMSLTWSTGSSRYEHLDDLTKVLCRLTGKQYEKVVHTNTNTKEQTTSGIGTMREYFNDNLIERGEWYDWGFFQFKCFNKGTMHIKFKDEKVWEVVNRKYADLKGQVLPESI